MTLPLESADSAVQLIAHVSAVDQAISVLDAFGFIVTLVDAEARICKFNRAAEQLSGYSFEEVAGRFVWEALLAEGSPESTQACFKSLAQGFGSQMKECLWLTKSGDTRRIRWDYSVVRDANDALAYVLAAGTDITAQRQTEDLLRQRNAQYQRIVESTGVIPYDYDYDQGTFNYIGPQTLDLLGYTVDQWLAPGFWENNIHPEDRPRVLAYTAKHAASGTDHELEYRFYDSTCAVRWVHDKVSVIKAQDGRTRLVGIVIDITARKATELRLEEAQKVAQLGIWELEAKTECAVWTNETHRILGCTPSTCHPCLETYLAATLPEDRPQLKAAFERLASGEASRLSLEHRIGLPSGEVRTLSVAMRGDYSSRGELLRVVGTMLDVTDRKKRTEALEHAHELMNALYAASPDMIFIHGEDGRLLDCNENACRGYGYSREDLLKSSFQELCGQGCSVETLQQLMQQPYLETEAPVAWIGRRSNGDEFPVELHIRPLKLKSRHTVAIHRDITEREERAAALRESEARFRTLFSQAPEALILVDPDTYRIIDANQNAQTLFGLAKRDLLHKTPVDLTPPDLVEDAKRGVKEQTAAALRGERPVFDWVHLRWSDGCRVHCRVQLAVIPVAKSRVIRASIVDVSDSYQAKQAITSEQERLRVTLEAIADAVITTDATGIVNYINPEAAALLHVSQGAARGQRWDRLLPLYETTSGVRIPDFVREVLAKRAKLGKENVTLRTANGSLRSLNLTCAPILLEDSILGCVLVLHDVTETQILSKQLAYLAHHDVLTGLPNRLAFEARLETASESARDEGRQHVLCFIDMDQLKLVNDSVGHAAGDELLKQLSGIMRRCLRGSDVLARLGGDEFGLLLHSTSLEAGGLIVEELLKAIRTARFVWDGKAFEISASIGMVEINSNSCSSSDLMRQADAACYIAKDNGRNRIHAFIPGDDGCERRRNEMSCVQTLRDALRNDEFELYVQRINATEAFSGETPRYEVLLRMRVPDGSVIPPIDFLPAAERYGLMPAIDRWVVDTLSAALCECADSQEGGHPRFAVNLSGPSLGDEDLLAHIERLLTTRCLDPKRIIFEITETSAIANMARAAQFIDRMALLGCVFALDDFGSGLSSFAYLKSMRVAYLKIDRAFIHNLHADPSDHAMVEAIYKVGKAMGLKIIAEGVEKIEIIECLKKIGIDYMQGYAIAMPQPLSDIINRTRLLPLSPKSGV